MLDPNIPALFVVSGLVGATMGAPVPEHFAAQVQLRALLEALTHADFVFTRNDGAWLSRRDFIAQTLQRPAAQSAVAHDEPVRLFGPVALVHGAYRSTFSSLRYTDVYLWGETGWCLVSAQDTPLKESVAHGLTAGQVRAHAPWQGRDPVGDDAAVLTTLNDRYVASFREADVAWYDAHLTSDYVVISSDGAYKDRAAALANFALPTFANNFKSFPVSHVQVRHFGDVALIHAANIYELKDGRAGESRYTDIWDRQGGRWRCIAAHITSHKAPR